MRVQRTWSFRRNPRWVRRSPEAREGPRPVPRLPTAAAQAAGALALSALPVRLGPPAQLEPHVERGHDGVQRAAGGPRGAEQGPPQHGHADDALAQPRVAVRRELVAVAEHVRVVPAVALEARHEVRRDAHEGAVARRR